MFSSVLQASCDVVLEITCVRTSLERVLIKYDKMCWSIAIQSAYVGFQLMKTNPSPSLGVFPQVQ
jgi:hypothetical protein